MATFTKDALYPGAYWVRDGKGGKRKVEYSRQDVAALRQRMADMLAAGLSIPLAAEHQDRAKPLTEAQRKAEWVKQLTMGWAEAVDLAPEGFLTAKLAVPNEEDAKRLAANRFVSPEIVNDFIDGTGRMWPGPSITHLAVTPRPVDAQQRPFQAVQMSDVVRLSLDDREDKSMADDKKEGKEEKPEKGGEEKKPPEKPKEGGESKAKGGLDLAGLRSVLDGDGYSVPGHITDPGEFLEHLHTAALSKKAMIDKLIEEVDSDEEDSDQAGDANQLPPGVTPENGPVLMSVGGHKFQIVRRANPAKKPEKKVPVQMSNEQQLLQRLEQIERGRVNEKKKALRQRIGQLFSVNIINGDHRDSLLKQLDGDGAVRMSLDDSGELAPNTVVAAVEALERVNPDYFAMTQQQLPPGVVAAPQQEGWAGHESREQVSQAVDGFFDMLPGAAAAKK